MSNIIKLYCDKKGMLYKPTLVSKIKYILKDFFESEPDPWEEIFESLRKDLEETSKNHKSIVFRNNDRA